MAETAAWTFMVYIAGDNNLSSAGDRDLREMRRIGSSESVHVVVEFDNAGERGARRYRVGRHGAGERVETLGETDSGSPATLLDFIRWTAAEYPAERYALVLWNHGGGWEPTEMDRIAREAGATDYDEGEGAERSATPLGRTFFRTSLAKIFNLPSVGERAICSDDGSGHSLDTIELEHVLAAGAAAIGRPFDLLGMDACLMSNLEVAYQVRAHARYLVASEESEPGQGWPYDRVLERLTSEPAMATVELTRVVVGEYMDSYLSRGFSGDVSQSAFDLSRVGRVTGPLDDLATALLGEMRGAAAEIWAAQRAASSFAHDTLWDIAHFCDELGARSTSDAVRAAAVRLRPALEVSLDGFLVAEAHSGRKLERCAGLSVYLIPPLLDISRYYADVALARDTRWLEMLQAYHAA